MSTAIEAAFEEWAEENKHSMDIMGDFDTFVIKKAFTAGALYGTKEAVKIIKEQS